jgi:lysophospholipase L1-like esterase
MLRSLWLRRLLLATVVPLIVVEIVLQLAALAVATFASSREHAGSGDCAVLCIGDSNTYGLGASRCDCSYPAVLETLLRDARDGGPARVENAGWPGRNSRSALELLPRHLQEFRPRRVAILLGTNDFWSHPDPVEIAKLGDPPPSGGSSSGFRLEWRLPRLIALLVFSPEVQGFFIPAGRATTGALLVGTWRAGSSQLELRADGSACFDGAPLRWTLAPKSIVFVGAGAPTPVGWRLENDRLALSVAGAATPREFVRAPTAPKPDLCAQAWQAINAGDLNRALQIARTWLADEPESPSAHGFLVTVGTPLARQDVVDEGLAWLRARRIRQPDVAVAEALAEALRTANLTEEAGRIARADLERWPGSVTLWTTLAVSADVARDLTTLEEAVGKAISLDRRESIWPLVANLRLRARAHVARSDARSAARDVLEAFAVDGREGELRNALRCEGMKCDPALVDELAPAVGLAGERLATAKRIAGEPAVRDDEPAAATLVDHLEQIVRYCRSHGAEPLLVTYPFHGDVVEKAQRTAARETGATLVDVTGRFDQLLSEHPREEFFVLDGHCNDAGYRSIAEEVARALCRH